MSGGSATAAQRGALVAVSRQTTSEDNYTEQLLGKLAARGERDAIVYEERRISGREARELVLRYAGALTDLGVDQGDGVALFSVNTPETLLLTLAVHFLGGRLVFVPPEPGNRELGSFIERADIKLLILDPVFTGRAAQLAEETKVVTYSLGPADGAPDFLAAVNPLTELAPEDAAPASAVVTLFYTGRTTGQPKLVPHGHGSYERIVKAADTRGSDAADPRLLAGTLLSHVSGHFTALMALFAGQTVVLMRGESFVTGRTSDNVYSRLLDDFLCTLPGIRQAAAVGAPDRELSEAVHVFLVPQDGVDLDLAAIGRQVVRELGDLYEPKSFTVTDSLPCTTAGKVDKKALRTAHLLAQAARSEASPVGSYA